MAFFQLNFRSALIGIGVDVKIFLPLEIPKGAKKTQFPENKRFQTLWLLHGGLGDGNDFVKYSNVLRYAQENRIALVIPSCPGLFYQSPYFDFITDELPALLQNMLPLSKNKEDNFIAGLSHGGDCALRATLEYPKKYAAGLVMSAAGTTHYNDGRENHLLFDIYGMTEKALYSGQQLPQLIFATGSGDSGFPHYAPVIDHLEKIGAPVKRYYVEGNGHSWPFWDDSLNRAIAQWLPLRRNLV